MRGVRVCHGEGELMGFCQGFAKVGAIFARLVQDWTGIGMWKWFRIKEA